MAGTMENFQRTRIGARLAALNISAFEAAKRAGFERVFIHDLLIAKKETIRSPALLKVAEVLDCDPEYLVGAQEAPRRNHQAQEASANG